jgi:hypothetical protein
MPGERDDGSKRVGWWRVTERGEEWVMNRVSVPARARVYDSRLLNLDATEGYVTIIDALGKNFDYRELMDG